MNSNLQIRHLSVMICALVLVLFVGFANNVCASWDYGNGRHGSFILTTNATIEQLYQTVRLPSDPPQYNPADTNAIPNFQTLTISPGVTLAANPWNGSSGGVIVLKVQGTLSVAVGLAISVSGIGYRGGQWFGGQYTVGVQIGESYAGNPVASENANYGGEGDGNSVWSVSNGHPNYTGTGAGGGYGEVGASSINSFSGYGGIGGGTYGTASLDIVYLGSGGGGSATFSSPNGGNGGGAIAINAGNLQVNGAVQANGANATGGGGSGGSIKLLVATANLGTNQITATGEAATRLAALVGSRSVSPRISSALQHQPLTRIWTPTVTT